ncbi:MAG: hypothetical protein ACTSR8_01250 [Promethearchaeota archaeon]
MVICWDSKADIIFKGDEGREIKPIFEKTYEDEDGTHYIFSKIMFKNPKYKIPEENFILFKKFLNGGSRSYPSDGAIPLDIVATETKLIIYKIMDIASTPTDKLNKDAKELLSCGKYGMVRGCVKLYLRKYTTRDWRRKRFTDDIDFWIYKLGLFEHVLRNCGWKKNSKTKEWEKIVEWINYDTKNRECGVLIASNDLNQAMDFGNCSYLEGSDLKSIFLKKLKRGHDVDLSDIINVAMVQYSKESKKHDEWLKAWEGVVESANTRSTRIISNLISLCRYSYGIANYIERVGQAISTFNELIYDKAEYPDSILTEICRYSSHWMGYLINNGAEATRNLIYSYLIQQQTLKKIHAKNLRAFANDVLELINSRLQHINTIIEIEL